MVRRKFRVSEVEDLKSCSIICMAKGCKRSFRGDRAGLRRVQTRSLSSGERVSDASSTADQSTLNVLGRGMR